jgi:hypothetical protein
MCLCFELNLTRLIFITSSVLVLSPSNAARSIVGIVKIPFFTKCEMLVIDEAEDEEDEDCDILSAG